ncbi:PMEI [Musa troglodytarum]|uniref:PMEI n=1 Tax=Musa troglodytarum TaxID=320322 RepID=A0A9E7L871_9LILI|nr:PMEI [Musa troglodytarum]
MLPRTVLMSSFFFLLAFVTCTSVPTTPTSPDENATEFIRARCGGTRYPDLCYTSLSGYAAAVHHSPLKLARVATNVTLARLRALCSHVSALRRARGAGHVAAALRDCADELGDAAYQVGRTATELRGLESVEEPEVAWRVSSAQTWMSAALTYEGTCSDGFQNVDSGGTSSVEADVCRRVGKVKQYTSNALALVNGLVDGR